MLRLWVSQVLLSASNICSLNISNHSCSSELCLLSPRMGKGGRVFTCVTMTVWSALRQERWKLVILTHCSCNFQKWTLLQLLKTSQFRYSFLVDAECMLLGYNKLFTQLVDISMLHDFWLYLTLPLTWRLSHLNICNRNYEWDIVNREILQLYRRIIVFFSNLIYVFLFFSLNFGTMLYNRQKFNTNSSMNNRKKI